MSWGWNILWKPPRGSCFWNPVGCWDPRISENGWRGFGEEIFPSLGRNWWVNISNTKSTSWIRKKKWCFWNDPSVGNLVFLRSIFQALAHLLFMIFLRTCAPIWHKFRSQWVDLHRFLVISSSKHQFQRNPIHFMSYNGSTTPRMQSWLIP